MPITIFTVPRGLKVAQLRYLRFGSEDLSAGIPDVRCLSGSPIYEAIYARISVGNKLTTFQ